MLIILIRDSIDSFSGRLEKDRWKKTNKSPHQQIMSKMDRRNHARQMRSLKHKEHEKSTSVFAGQTGAPRIVAVVPLTDDVEASYAIEKLSEAVDIDVATHIDRPSTFRIDRFKQSIQFVPLAFDILTVLDACKVADYVIFILSSTEEVDEKGEQLLRAVEGQGISNTLTVVQGLDAVEPPKKRPQILTSLKSFITHFFATLDKIHSLDSRQECTNVMRSLCTSTPRGVRWREERSWMLVEDTKWHNEDGSKAGEVVLTGVVRGKGMNANRLIQVGDWGSFQINKIVSAPLPALRKRKANEMTIDEQQGELLEEPDADQDDLAELAPEEVGMESDDDLAVSEAPAERKGVLLDDHHYYSDDNRKAPELPKRVPKGTSSYQAAWFLGDEPDSGSDWEEEPVNENDIGMNVPALPQDGTEGLNKMEIDATEAGPSEYPQSEVFVDPSPNDEAEQLAAYRTSRKTEAEEDLEFPDEIELHPNVLARERLARYRGLKSLRTSHWDTEEDKIYQAEGWNRFLQVSDYRAAKGSATREALVGGVKPGTRVSIHIRNVPTTFKSSTSPSTPLTAFSFLRHEKKHTVLNFSITLSSDHPKPLKSKDELILQCGPRRLTINPLFSAPGSTPNDVHKFSRYLHPGHTAIATFIGPVTWGSLPALFFQRSSTTDPDEVSESLTLVATGTSLPPSTSRVIAKRIILTGHPYKIHKKQVTVRYMFFNAEDVAWFKALQLWTRRGRSGFIKESLGTHGYFKANFDGKIDPQESIGVSLYKRVWPRESQPFRMIGNGKGKGKEVEREEGVEGMEGVEESRI